MEGDECHKMSDRDITTKQLYRCYQIKEVLSTLAKNMFGQKYVWSNMTCLVQLHKCTFSVDEDIMLTKSKFLHHFKDIEKKYTQRGQLPTLSLTHYYKHQN